MAAKKIKPRATFRIEFSRRGRTQTVYWGWRWGNESDAYYRFTVSPKHCDHLGSRTEKTELMLVDFLYFHRKVIVDGKPLKLNGTIQTRRQKLRSSLLIADFDQLPQGFATYKQLRAHLRERFPEALVLPTPSRKVKILFLVEQDVEPDTEEYGARWAALRQLLGDERLVFDHRVTAMHLAYITSEALEVWKKESSRLRPAGRVSELAAQWSSRGQTATASVAHAEPSAPAGQAAYDSPRTEAEAKPRPLALDPNKGFRRHAGTVADLCLEPGKGRDSIVGIALGEAQLRRFRGEIPAKLLSLGGRSKVFEPFLRLLIAQADLENATELPQTWYAHAAGISLSLVNRFLLRLVKARYLEKVDESYRAGVSSKKYRAKSLLLDVNGLQ